ncbi:threonine-phosphate decarboxylase CobD [Thalassotalea marina]|uniref:threonine-phosphate decarboxylase n=1 Tax=Thalassotalea marina TaxID=1673741 RepID=A0A919EFX2_9GAMM|nr:threonine-phosphate decarboxylase CobD [Thalassotalea marina]GHF77835.1 threonine-phosphate decarboxylase [Thalassotalea marina]
MLKAKNAQPLVHGGQLTKVASQYDFPLSEWLDLSTGIAPFSYPIPEIPLSIWQNLPSDQQALINAAKHYYQSDYCLVSNGSQPVIELLPALWLEKNTLPASQITVYLPQVGYKEHQKAWQLAGFELSFYQDALPQHIKANSVVVVINPNNPSGKLYELNALIELQQRCQLQGALLVVDEAFIDVIAPSQSIIANLAENTLVLRSFGKFFGLAGIRIGFVCCQQAWYQQIKAQCGPWQVNGPALFIAEKALLDTQWQQQQRAKLVQQQQQLSELLSSCGFEQQVGCSLFITCYCDHAAERYQTLCQHGIYVRLTDEQDALRFGIPNTEQIKILKERLTKIFS